MTNPGPPRTWKYPCGNCCKQPVKSNQDGLQCDACDSWYHLRCLPEAIRISRAEYTRLSETNEDWYCYECQLPTLIDSFFSTTNDNTDHANVSEHTSSMCTELILELNELRIKNSKSIIIGNLNINSLRNKFNEVKEILNNRLLDCLILCETKLDASFPDAKCNVTEYRMYRQDRNAHGGHVFFIRSNNTKSKCKGHRTRKHRVTRYRVHREQD